MFATVVAIPTIATVVIAAPTETVSPTATPPSLLIVNSVVPIPAVAPTAIEVSKIVSVTKDGVNNTLYSYLPAARFLV